MANDPSQNEENPVWQEHYRRWSAVNALREQQREAAFAPFAQRQKQFEQHLRSEGRAQQPRLPSSGLTPAQQQQAAGYNNQQRQSLRSRSGAGMRQPSPSASGAPSPDRQQTQQQQQDAGQPAGNDEQEHMTRLAHMRTLAQREQRLARIRRLQQTMKAGQWGFRLSEAGGILTVVGAFGSLLAMNVQLIFGNFFHGQFLLPIPPLSKVEKWATIGADLLTMFFLFLALVPFVLAFALLYKYKIFLQFLPADWLIKMAT